MLENFKENYLFFAIGAVIIGLICGVFLYDTWGGIFMTLFWYGVTFFACRMVIRINGTLWAGSRRYLIYIVLLAMTLSFTSNRLMIACDLCGTAILLSLFLYHQFSNDDGWGFLLCARKLMDAVFCPIARFTRIFEDCLWYRKNKEISSIYIHIIAGIAIAVPLTIFMTSILMSADMLFENIINSVFGWMYFDIHVGSIIKFFVITLFAYGFFAFMFEQPEADESGLVKKYEPVTAVIAYGTLTVMYILFSLVQFSYLFMDQEIVYSAYAREGFFKLTFVAFINLVLVINGVSRMRKSRWLDRIMLVMSGCTYVMMISATVRMFAYVKAYDLTVLRLLVLWAILVIAIVFVGVIKSIFREKYPLFRYAMHVFTILFIILSFARPDYLVAKYNLEFVTDYRDFEYLADLSIDAYPVYAAAENKYGYDEDYIHYAAVFDRKVRSEWKDPFVKAGLSEIIAKIAINSR